MVLSINTAIPRIMHIDLNSCFAHIEQQANPLLRGRPVGVAAYQTPNAIILSPSYEAKKYGVKVGTSVREARSLCPQIIILSTDPPKYRIVQKQFIKILMDYSAKVTPKSIDEAVVDFTDPALHGLNLESISYEIKNRIKQEIGEWITCNVGIGTNRFLAKTAAGLHKPDGLDKITHHNLLSTLETLTLLDLHGINVRYQRRLYGAAIFTPLDFFNASLHKLHKQVFKSIMGYHWYLRLHGWETDAVDFARKSVGHSYSLQNKTDDYEELLQVLMKMCEKTGRRLRQNNLISHGIYLGIRFIDYEYVHQSRSFHDVIYSNVDIYKHAKILFDELFPHYNPKIVKLLAVGCFNLESNEYLQLELFNSKKQQITYAMDKINDRYGNYTLTTARMMLARDAAPDAIAFGGVKDVNYDD